jgi:predicted dehydrogenase
MSGGVRIAVAGAGLIGRRHAGAIRSAGETLAAIADPAPAARAFAERLGVPWVPDLAALLAGPVPDGVILATPNAHHVEGGLACVAAGLPVLVEKPLAADAPSGLALVTAAEAAGVALLVGHHRRHNGLVARAKALIDAGALGRILAVQATFWLRKPDDYFETPWRREPGAGPILLNLIHDIDTLRHLAGEIVSVRAVTSNAVRGHPVEETAAILLRFAGGALGTVSVSDAVPAPWSWELTARENPAYPPTGAVCCQIGGTDGALELPALRLWSYAGRQSWWEPLTATHHAVPVEDPLTAQVRHFARVIRGEEAPLVSGREGLGTLRVVEAIRRSAGAGHDVAVEGTGTDAPGGGTE